MRMKLRKAVSLEIPIWDLRCIIPSAYFVGTQVETRHVINVTPMLSKE
jgi:hypothetical protein